MLQLSGSFINKPVLSLRTGGAVGTIVTAIINPNNLKIEGFYCTDRFNKGRLILLSVEIRDIIADGIVVDDHEAMSDPKDLVRLQKILDVNFSLIGKKVLTSNKQALGKVEDYAVDNVSMFIQKLYVAQSLIKNFKGGQLSIDRNNILEITDRVIVVQDLEEKVPAGSPLTAPAS